MKGGNKRFRVGDQGLRRGIKGTRAEKEMQRLWWKTKGADSAKGDIKCMTVKMIFEGRNKGLWEKIKGTQAEEENKRLREKVNGADSATERNKKHENNM